MKFKKREMICGHVEEIYYDEKVRNLHVELTRCDGIPCVELMGDKDNTLLRLHVKEAITFKSIVDTLVVDYLEDLVERFEEGVVSESS